MNVYFLFYCHLSGFVCRLLHLSIRALCNFFRARKSNPLTPTQPAEVRRCPYVQFLDSFSLIFAFDDSTRFVSSAKNITLNAKSKNIKTYISKVHRTLNHFDFLAGRVGVCWRETKQP